MVRLALRARDFGLMVAVCGASQVTAGDSDQRKPLMHGKIQVAVAELKSPDPQVSKHASEVLSERPCSESGPPIVQSLDGDPRFGQPIVRRIAFEVLSTCTGEKGNVVERVMLLALADADAFVVASCARGLSTATPIAKAEAATLLAERWNDWVKPGDDPPGWLVEAISQVGATRRLLEKFSGTNDDTRKSMLWTVGMIGSKTNGAFDGNPEYQQGIRNFIIESLDSSSEEVRRAAAEALSPAFGADTVIFKSPTEYKLNLLLEETLERVAQNTSDAFLRERANETLKYFREHLDDVAQKILRERKKELNKGLSKPVP